MSQDFFHAIYEHGVLRPLIPLNIPESTEVIIRVQQTNGLNESAPDDPLVGFMSDEADLMDSIVEEAMLARVAPPYKSALRRPTRKQERKQRAG